MKLEQFRRLRVLIQALRLELERIDWEDADAENDHPDEVDFSADYFGFEWAHLDDDLPDEIDSKEWPLCGECGNFSHSCIC